ncbi:type II secretion system major pseudopilin GspG [Phenylobacterium sp.]|uniref:type II secretion system major pseudopilin GspG n=1 Tax=Phenylobacterium sp. TaxID=1871053 RepID=UPI0028A2876E|nr:type II secretion system major pseudopilin GspG [Phenylobacterium sp.]
MGAEDGYTLTEMLVVIAIIALIAAVLTPQLIGQMSRARAKTAQLQLETVASSVELFRSDVGRYPTETEGLRALLADPGGVEGWLGPYLKDEKNLNDPWSRPIIYRYNAENLTFYVETRGRDGKEGGGGADGDIRAPSAPSVAPPPVT